MTAPQTFAVHTFGCQMNVYDSERIAETLAADGMAVAGEGVIPDLVVLNTCHIREKASEKVYSEIGRLKKRGVRLVAVAGCVAQAEGAEIVRRAKGVDIVVGPLAYHRLPEMVAGAAARPVDTDMPAVPKFAGLPARGRVSPPSAFLTVQEGCDKFCAFCVVPYTRGAEYSRPFADVLAEAEALVAGGARELVLLGQNVNAWAGADGTGTASLAGLIRRLAAMPGLARIRYTTSHPLDMRADLIAAHADVPQLMPYLHLPVQSGSDRMLARMNRRHSVGHYRDIVAELRAARPHIALSSDFIVGHPGESDADFDDTLALVSEIGFAQAYSFRYSPRPGTPAARAADPVAADVADARLARLQALLAGQQAAFNARAVGHTFDLLLTRPGRLPGQFVGHSPWQQSVHVTAPGARAGDLVPVTVRSAGPRSLDAVLATPVLAHAA